MLTILAAAAALVAVAVAAYLLGELRVTRRVVREQAEHNVNLTTANSALLDRLVIKHGFMPLADKPVSPNLPIQSMELADPFTIAEGQWAREDDFRLRAMSAAEQAEIEEAARQRGN